jgi:EAL domain-containing protein (putative c-di-GMP-specific phosphodiesterase class I)
MDPLDVQPPSDPFQFVAAADRTARPARDPQRRTRAKTSAALGPEFDHLPPAAPRPRPGAAPWLEDVSSRPAERVASGCCAAPERNGVGLALEDVRDMFEDGRFWTEYQAIVDARTGRTAGYEALGRFTASDGTQVPPARIFALLHADPALLLRAELRLKLHQIQHAPDAPLFINLDAGSWTRAAHSDGNPFAGLISSSPRRVVVEITESCSADHALRAAEVITSIRNEGFTVALDDLGATNALFSFDAIAGTDVLKFDRAIVGRLGDARCRAFVQTLIAMTQETGAYTVLEGVERPEEFARARELGFDFVQGYLFRDRSHASTTQ